MSITADRIIAVSTGKTVYKDGDSVIKVFCRPYTKLDVMKEAFNQTQLEAAKLSVPKVQEVFLSEEGWAIRYEYARGKALSHLMEAIPAKVSDYMAQLVKIQRAIAAADAPLLPCLTDKLKHAICEGIQDKEQRISLCAALDSLPDGQATCHGALMPQDIIMNQNGGYCILNWANARAAIPCLTLQIPLFSLHLKIMSSLRCLNYISARSVQAIPRLSGRCSALCPFARQRA